VLVGDSIPERIFSEVAGATHVVIYFIHTLGRLTVGGRRTGGGSDAFAKC